jgi:2-polyprenyl-3-methyl-5-hydroxy-6-metoxy-1,4-benzoquinol methylase
MVQRKMGRMNKDTQQRETSFGFRTVAEDDRQGLVNEVFAKVAASYDQMNDLMSGGLHRLWKDDFIALLNPPKSDRAFKVLDVAGGTGDIAFRIAGAGGSGTHVTVADISENMVREGAPRSAKRAGAEVQFHRWHGRRPRVCRQQFRCLHHFVRHQERDAISTLRWPRRTGC